MAGPIILSNVSVPLLGAVDTAVMGHLSEPYYIGAVALGAMLFNFIYHGFNCLRMGTTGPTAQARGAGHYAEVRAMVGRALLLAGILGGLVVLMQLPIVGFALWAIESSTEVETLARRYFLIRVWAMPAVLGTYAIIGWLYGLRDARVPLVLQIFTNSLNIVLDFVFVFGLGWDVGGVAAASVIAEYAGLALGLFFVWRRLKRLPAGRDAARILDPARLRRMITVNTDIFIRTMCVVTVSALFIAKSAALGDVPLAANQVLHNFVIFTSFGLDGVAHAAEAILGESVGRRDRAAFRSGVRIVLLWAGLVGLVFLAAYALAGTTIIALLTTIPEVRALARAFLPWAVLMPVVSIWGYTYDGVFLAATRTGPMRNSMLLSLAVFLILLYTLMPFFGNVGIWTALTVFLGMRGLTLHLFYPALMRAV
jgi:MATE family multidrug resistance protein